MWAHTTCSNTLPLQQICPFEPEYIKDVVKGTPGGRAGGTGIALFFRFSFRLLVLD